MLKEKKKKRKEHQNVFDFNIKFISFYLKANTATVSPPLSSVFGNLGLNTMKFCKEFNALTEQLTSYFLLKVYVKIDLKLKTWTLKISTLPLSYFYNLISFTTQIQYAGLGGFFVKQFFFITLKNFFLIIIFFFNDLNEKVIRNKLGILKSMHMLIYDELINNYYKL